VNAPATTTGAAKPVSPAPGGADGVAVAMGLAFAFMWSSAFTSAKIALADAPPFLLLGARFALAGLVAVAIAALAGQKFPRDRRAWTLIALFGFCQNSLYLGLNFLAMTTIPAGLAAIIASSLPLLVAAIDRAFFGARLPWLGVLGLLAGFAGVLVIMGGRIAGGVDPIGLALCLVGALALAAATLIVRAMTAGGGGGGGLMAVGLQMLVGAVTLAPVGLVFESMDDVRPTLSLGLAFAYTAIVPGVVATLVWFRLVARIGATAASAFHFLNPAFGVGVAAAMLGEAVGWMDAAGVAVVTLGIAAVQWARIRG
jgi:drug/metabolite transporter (DMT)-like permease